MNLTKNQTEDGKNKDCRVTTMAESRKTHLNVNRFNNHFCQYLDILSTRFRQKKNKNETRNT